MSEVNGGLRMKVIGKQIRKYRNEKGYAQEQLGKLLGVSTQAVSKWERAEASPDTDNLIIPKVDDCCNNVHS